MRTTQIVDPRAPPQVRFVFVSFVGGLDLPYISATYPLYLRNISAISPQVRFVFVSFVGGLDLR